MSLTEEASTILRDGFNHPRKFGPRPKLPQGYEWNRSLLYRYSPPGYWQLNYYDDPTRYKRRPRSIDPRVAVFCHRGLYDRALKIPENSVLAIENGQDDNRLHCHELDARISASGSAHKSFLAHDEVAGRVTSKKRRWASLSLKEILETTLVARRFNFQTEDLASSYENTGEKVPGLEELLERARSTSAWAGLTLQLDLRGHDFPRAIEWFSRRMISPPILMLKGYNLFFESGDDLLKEINKIRRSGVNNKASQHKEYPGPVDKDDSKSFSWDQLTKYRVRIIVVFYSQPIMKLALKRFTREDPGRLSNDELLEKAGRLSYNQFLQTARDHIQSFNKIIQPDVCQFIPEIVSSGLGLGYSVKNDRAINPLDGTVIKDPEVIFESRLDRAMIQVTLELKEKYPKMIFSSCVRLCEVRTTGPNSKELVADMRTGRLKTRPSGEKGISTKLRTIHGGLYPQSHIVVADDPFAEIAARVWIDEYAKLDRKELLTIADSNLTYNDWLRKAGSSVEKAVNDLNGPFLPNTYDGPVDDNWNIKIQRGNRFSLWAKGTMANVSKLCCCMKGTSKGKQVKGRNKRTQVKGGNNRTQAKGGNNRTQVKGGNNRTQGVYQ